MTKKFRQLGATVGLLLLMVLLLISVYTYVLYQNFSRNMLEAALMAGICSVGGDVMPLGTIPTPAVAYLTVLEQADAGIPPEQSSRCGENPRLPSWRNYEHQATI